jgi:Flp pilus assembly protein TadG
MKRLFRSLSGTSSIEFALLAPVLSLILVGIVDTGRYCYVAILAANAARAGAQYGAQNLETAYDTPGITNAAIADGESLPNWTAAGGGVAVNQLCAIDGNAPQTCNTPWGSSPPRGTIYYVEVQVTGTFNTLLTYPGMPNALPVSGASTMRVATQ